MTLKDQMLRVLSGLIPGLLLLEELVPCCALNYLYFFLLVTRFENKNVYVRKGFQ